MIKECCVEVYKTYANINTLTEEEYYAGGDLDDINYNKPDLESEHVYHFLDIAYLEDPIIGNEIMYIYEDYETIYKVWYWGIIRFITDEI